VSHGSPWAFRLRANIPPRSARGSDSGEQSWSVLGTAKCDGRQLKSASIDELPPLVDIKKRTPNRALLWGRF